MQLGGETGHGLVHHGIAGHGLGALGQDGGGGLDGQFSGGRLDLGRGLALGLGDLGLGDLAAALDLLFQARVGIGLQLARLRLGAGDQFGRLGLRRLAAGPERIWLFLGMALTESMGIFALVVALLLRYT